MADYDEDFNNLCVNDLCINEYDFEKTSVIRPPEKKNVKLAQRFIFVDTADVNLNEEKTTFTIDFGETIKDVVEIELMSCNLPKTYPFKDTDTYLLLFIENLDIDNYKISSNSNVTNCFARLPIPDKSKNVFFGRIKNFTNSYTFKPTLQKINKLNIKITNREGVDVGENEGKTFFTDVYHVQLTFAITYQTQSL